MTNRNPLRPLETELFVNSHRSSSAGENMASFNSSCQAAGSTPASCVNCHKCPAYFQGHCLVTTDECQVKSANYRFCDTYKDFVKPYNRSYAHIRDLKKQDSDTTMRGDVMI